MRHAQSFRRVLAAGLFVFAIGFADAQQAAKTAAASTHLGFPRTPDGHPDLQGYWCNASITPLAASAGARGERILHGRGSRGGGQERI